MEWVIRRHETCPVSTKADMPEGICELPSQLSPSDLCNSRNSLYRISHYPEVSRFSAPRLELDSYSIQWTLEATQKMRLNKWRPANTASQSSVRRRLRSANRYSYCAKTRVGRTCCLFAVSGGTAHGTRLRGLIRWRQKLLVGAGGAFERSDDALASAASDNDFFYPKKFVPVVCRCQTGVSQADSI